MIAKIIEKNNAKCIHWIEGSEMTPISYKYFMELPCENPRDVDESLGPYFDITLRELVCQWAKNNANYDLKEAVFGFPKETFRDALIEFIESDYKEFPVFMHDLTYYVSNNYNCRTRYDVFVAFVREFSRIVY